MLGKTVLDFLGSLFGGGMSYAAQREANIMNMKMQYDFAQRGIQMKVKDAKEAGIHPLYALGAVTHSPSVAMQSESGLGRGISNALKGLGANLSVERKLQQELLRSQIGENMSDILLKTEKRKRLMEEDKDMLNDAKSRIGQEINSEYHEPGVPRRIAGLQVKYDKTGMPYLDIPVWMQKEDGSTEKMLIRKTNPHIYKIVEEIYGEEGAEAWFKAMFNKDFAIVLARKIGVEFKQLDKALRKTWVEKILPSKDANPIPNSDFQFK